MKAQVGVLLGLSILMLASAHAGPGEGGGAGGGKGVVCRDGSGAIKSVEVLDLWEAREIYKRPAQESQEPLDVQAHRAAALLKNSVWNEESLGYAAPQPGHPQELTGSDALLQILTDEEDVFIRQDGNVTMLTGAKLQLTPDSYEIAVPAQVGCAVEQIVRYEDTPRSVTIYVDADIYSKMSLTQKAALLAHEALYKYLRDTSHEQNSIRVRRAIGAVFSGYQFPAKQDYSPGRQVICETDDFTPADGETATRIEIFETAAPNWVNAPFIMRIMTVEGIRVFGGYTPLVSGRQTIPNFLDLLMKGAKQPNSSKHTTPPTGNVFSTGLNWYSAGAGQVNGSQIIHDIENETDIAIGFWKYADGSMKMQTQLKSSTQKSGPSPTRWLNCYKVNDPNM